MNVKATKAKIAAVTTLITTLAGAVTAAVADDNFSAEESIGVAMTLVLGILGVYAVWRVPNEEKEPTV